MRKVLISVAPVSAACKKIEPEKIAEDVIACGRAGAAMVHLHVRAEDGSLTPDLSLLEKTVSLIRSQSDLIIQASTGGVSDLTIKERCAPLSADWVEAASLNVGSVNLGEAVYQNPIRDVRYCVEQILKHKKIPEIEVFELGMIHTAMELSKEFDFVKPLLFAVVLGHKGAAPATERILDSMLDALDECFPEKGQALWGITHAGRKDFSIIEAALKKGASTVRIGFEDSDCLDFDRRADTNLPLVLETVKLIRSLNMEPATPSEARKMLNLHKNS